MPVNALPHSVGRVQQTCQPLSVLHVYAGNLYGGIERLLNTFAQKRHDCPEISPSFGLCFEGRLLEELVSADVPVHHLGAVRFSRPWTLWRARARLRTLLSSQRFDAVITHAAWPHAVFAGTVHKARIPLVNWVHDQMSGPSNRFEKRAAANPPALVVANSQFTARSVSRVFPGIPTEVVYLPVVAPADFSAQRTTVRAELKTSENDVVIIQASRLERWKGHQILLESLARLKDLPGWTAWIAGGPQKGDEGVYFHQLQILANERGIADRLRFLGQRTDVHRLLAAADLLCQPNTEPEPFGITFVEALHAGIPVITTDIGGGREVVSQDCGILVPPGDVAATATALNELLASPSRRKALGLAGPARAAELCDPVRQLSQLAGLLRRIAA